MIRRWLGVVLFLAACKQPPPPEAGADAAPLTAPAAGVQGAAQASCVRPATGVCIEYIRLAADALADQQRDCERDQGTWSGAACPAADLLGACSNLAKDVHRRNKLYRSAAFKSAADARREMCSDPGDVFEAQDPR